MENIVIGIEGMVGSGKTTICRELTNLIPNSVFIDGGEIYRGIVEAAVKSGLNISELKNTNPLELMKKLQVEFKIEDNSTKVYIQGKKIEKEIIQSAKSSMGVSIMASVSNNEELYKFARKIVDTYKEKFNIILSAREIITIYPNIDCHVFITADIKERVKRRYNQYKGKYTIEQIEEMINKRDQIHEQSGFNKLGKNSIKVDVTECKDAQESAKKVLTNIQSFLNKK